MGENEQLQPAVPPVHSLRSADGKFFPKPPTQDARRKLRAQYRAAALVADVDALLAEYNQKSPEDFVMAKMLGVLRALERASDRAEHTCNKEADPKARMAQVAALSKLAKQRLETAKAIANYQETSYHRKVKAARGNKSAAPGQIVAMAPAQPAAQAQP